MALAARKFLLGLSFMIDNGLSLFVVNKLIAKSTILSLTLILTFFCEFT